jgi:hypothetical protein
MACPLTLFKKLHFALLQFVFIHKHFILSLMGFGSCPCVKYRDLRVTLDTADRPELLRVLLNEVYVNTSWVFRIVQWAGYRRASIVCILFNDTVNFWYVAPMKDEWSWNTGGMVLGGKTQLPAQNPSPVHFYTVSPTWIGLGSKLCPRG